MRGRRLPARVRVLLALGAALLIHGAFGQELESMRVRVLGSASARLLPAWLGPAAGPAVLGEDSGRRVAAWREGRAARIASEGRAAVPVLFFRPADRVAIIGAGSASGLSVFDPVEVPAGLLGFIDAVESRLSRVRLLSSPKSRVPVTVADPRRELPGELTGLNAILEGSGDGGRLVAGSLLAEFRPGDVLKASILPTADGADSRQVPVGVVAAEGREPAVRLLAGPADLGFVTVASGSAPAEALFEHCPLEVRAAPLVQRAGVLLTGAGAARAAPGCAVHASGRYLGRVTLATAAGVVASGLADPGHRLFVRCFGQDGATFAGELLAMGGGRFRIQAPPGLPIAGSLLAVTAGGQELIPADLAVGELEPAGDDWAIRDGGGRWPRQVMVSVFLADAELQRLVKP